ncbi:MULTISPECIES: GNAT family N-acetyltransferase [unclassified Paenibacillus]|uniref:GNAT family N-acetyltransferase n=1 Tax=unclassified Paenibacillus TaxID=185978 RepID=UPI0009542B38|nr:MULTISPECIES: GNAT family N-acetyltransferase [unclassified Paenibacillus]ASS68168.1 GNAT family N-acetyltransferase [Paenibacillus sp. RUD330]SIR69973.1 Predicted acetyltransferase [Paenibacillus sp. RU4X]SIR77192.1 Predicted acetyltransferase [Paenibacillus sp. RU4T]
MKIRTLKPEEFDEHMKLSQYAFQMELSAEELEQAKARAKCEEVIVGVEQERIVSQVRIIPFEVNWNGIVLKMGGVSSVASWPESRRSGHVGKLLRHAMEEMKANGQSISMLAPFSIGFYRKYGWELFIDRVKYTLATDKLPQRMHNNGKVERIQVRDHAELLGILYETYSEGFNGTLARTADWWEHSVFKRKQGSAVLYRTQNGTPEGYALYKVKDRRLDIHELVYLTEEARVGLWNFFSNHDSMIESAVLHTYSGDPLPYQLTDPRIEQSIHPYFMVRIVDVQWLVKQLPFQPGVRDQFVLQIHDEDASWNDGLWMLDITDEGKGSLSRYQDGTSSKRLDLSIGTLASLLIGYKSARDLQQMDHISGPRSEAVRLGSRIPDAMTNFMDFF